MIIGLTGYARSGKDEVAKILVEEFGYKRVAFADKIKTLLYETNPQVGGNRLQHLVSTYGWDVAKSQPEVRHLLQTLGVSARKIFGENFWVDQAILNVHPSERIVISDVRFENEAERIQSLSGQIWRIKRTGVQAVNAHVSETQMDGYKVDKILQNGGTLDELKILVQTRLGSLVNGN